ncbi:ATP-binding protein [Prosthecobacter sp. SYSU 5D2]|uniref:ATP-binding protein n=1 Tax=Prosthecobacter sp. SYSU 5D2 TaxID=3134134 RepID=UPI0031FEF3BC
MKPAVLPFLNDVPIKRKLTILIMVISSAALLLACAAILLHERHAFRETMARDLEIIADTFDDNVASGLAFNDPESIAQTLKTLKANPTIMAACVYDENRQRVAEYLRSDMQGHFPFDESQPTGQHFHDDRLDTHQDITLDGETIGSVYIAADLTAITYRLQRSATIIFIVICGALLLAFFLSTSLQKIISGPITHLAEVASTVAAEKDYSVRAVKQSEDELGSLIDAFNEMLSQIQQQDSALQMARDNLETRVQERTRELARSLSLLNATLDSTADGIIAFQFTGEIVCYNSQFADMWEVPKTILEKPAMEELQTCLADKTTDPEAFIQRARVQDEKQAFDIIRLKSGQTFERYVKPQQVDGRQVGLVVNFRDITAREHSEASLAEANARLFATSRQAGMAEVATSILHNVGNVLNSVSVSAEVVSTRVQQFRIGSLRSLGELLRKHEADLPAFLTQDPQGREVPAFLLKLVNHLEEPQQAILGELESLRKNIEHIKEIVSMQQSYARGCGVLESLTMSELIEDAIRINAAGFTRHELTLIRDIQDDRPVLTDRHKVLQILVNLLGNAKYAVSHAPGEKHVIIRVTRDEKDAVHIAVTDNGIGIEPENLTRIFQHGFTTKKDGHGFGLHSGALAARELGGRLTATSAGPGQGATFVLELPPSSKDLPL